METKPVLLVDAFADEVMGGVPIAVVPDEITRSQLRAVASELGTSGAVAPTQGGDHDLVYVECDETQKFVERNEAQRLVERNEAKTFVEGAIAGCSALIERELIELGEQTMLVVDADGDEREVPVHINSDRYVAVTLADHEVTEASISLERLAPALGVDVAALEDVATELPVGRTDAFGGTLFVPVTFLSHLTSSSPDRETLTAVLEETDTARVCAFTFDTLGQRTHVHARVFDPSVPGCERAASGVAIAGAGRYFTQYGAFDAETAQVRVECGYVLDRPGTVVATLGQTPEVGGTGLTVLDGTITVPEERDDDIVML